MNIKIFSVGGTIDKVYFDRLSEYQVGSPSVRNILDGLPTAFSYEIESILRKDSLDLDEQDRDRIFDILAKEPCRRIIVTHGTDTMIETARCLLEIPDKCIVLTGAMEPASFQSSDAVFNIGFAAGAVSTLDNGVYIAMGGRVFDPLKCRKNRQLGRFEPA